jgi:DNA-binding NarL/FixJ family response regulator
MKPIRVLVADDHALVRAGFRVLLDKLPGIEVVGEASDGREVLRLLESCRPDVVLMDISMPGLNGVVAAARVTSVFPHVRVIILSMHANEEYVLQALRAGAVGYLLKDSSPAELRLAITAAARGETYLSPPVSKQVIADYVRRVGEEESTFDRLTPRQREVLQLIAEGSTSREIARALGISVKTVETHRARLMERLDVHDIAGLVRRAIEMGLVELRK